MGSSPRFFPQRASRKAWSALQTAAHDKDAKDAGDAHRASPWQASLADLNGDRRADVLLYNHDSGAMLEALSRADGTFEHHSAPWTAGWNLLTADLNGDGRADMLLYDPKSGAWVQGISDGRGGFAYRRGTWASGLHVELADFNGDGRVDALFYNASTGSA